MKKRLGQSFSCQLGCFFVAALLFAAPVSANAPDAGDAEQVPAATGSDAVGQSAPAGNAAAAGTLEDEVATQFAQTCAGCHTIGGGALRAPDLSEVALWPEAQISTAIQTMQRKVGPLTPKLIADLTALLKDGKARARIDAARAKMTRNLEQSAEPPNSLVGGSLFFGRTPLENGGMSCNSCHQYRGEGGTIGPDLSHFAEGTDVETLAGSIARASFPVMRGAYKDHPLSQQEARHIAAFMQQAQFQRVVVPPSHVTAVGLGCGLAAFAAGIAYVLTRPRGVRSRLIQRANKR